jgi:hypothetical protein
MADAPLLPAEKAFFRLLIDLAGDGLFCHRPGVQERLMEAFEAAMEEAKATEKPHPRDGVRLETSQ